jgi:hypothetical protein
VHLSYVNYFATDVTFLNLGGYVLSGGGASGTFAGEIYGYVWG